MPSEHRGATTLPHPSTSPPARAHLNAPPPDSKHAQADSHYFNRREFCFTLNGDIFVRYQAFKVREAIVSV